MTSRQKNPPKLLECYTCGKTFKSASGLKDHQTSIHEEIKHKCKFCGKLLTTQKKLTLHLQTHEDKEKKPRFKCDECSKTFLRLGDVKRHKVTHLGDAAKIHKCEQCEKTFIHRRDLDRHARTHSGVKPYICGKCSKTFSHTSHLRRHQRSVKCNSAQLKPELSKVTFDCEICDFKYKTQEGLQAHQQRIHMDEQ